MIWGARKIKSAHKVPRKKFKLLFGALILLALFDLIATILWLSIGAAEEANPLMNVLTENSMISFAIGKLLLTFVSVLLLKYNSLQRPRLIFKVSSILVLVYVAINIWHFVGLFHFAA